MIYIEKLSLKNVGKYTWQTFIDNFLSSKQSRTYILEEVMPGMSRSYINTDMLTPYVLPKLKGVTLGKYFGTTGIDIDLLLAGNIEIENLVIEISLDNLNSLPKSKIKKLLEQHIIILNDFEEGGNFFGHKGLVDFLVERNIKPKKLFLVGGCFQQHDYPELNIIRVDYDYWMIISATVNEDFSRAILDKAYQQSLLDRLDNAPENFCIIPIFKPRKHRMDFLCYLDSIGVLNKCDWSLAYNYNNKINSYRSLNVKNLEIGKQEEDFLSKYTFPKLLSKNAGTEWKDIIAPSMNCFNQYKYFVSVETYLGHERKTQLGDCGFMTEKTFKLFLTGSAPIVYGPAGSVDRLHMLGFKTIDNTLDTTDYVSVGDLINSLHAQPRYERELIKHNFERITDKEFLSNHVAQTLNKIADLINSIRR